ncbi:MAG: hypothetical protein FWC69_02935 [Defluviitaleaceae bacterium]|nr:hypothetical protein [Defluviitaleaceae bacterium]
MKKETVMRKSDLDNLIEQHKVQPVGNGYIDCIVSLESALDFIAGLSSINIKIYGLTWWCHCKDQISGCPHGMGGPISEYYDGWFSEMWFPVVEFEDNEQVIKYLKALDDPSILKCFMPALWLDVPDDWTNESHSMLVGEA